MKKIKELTKAQLKANARNQLFRQIHGSSINHFANIAIKHGAITNREFNILVQIEAYLYELKKHQFEGSKEVGLHPRRRCSQCNGIAHWKVTICGRTSYYCNKHKKEAERDNKQNSNGEWMVTDIHHIDPNK